MHPRMATRRIVGDPVHARQNRAKLGEKSLCYDRPVNFAKLGIIASVVAVNIAFTYSWIRHRHRCVDQGRPTLADIGIGALTDFLDGLGIGSFAPTTAIFKFRRRPADELIPGTLNIGHNPAAMIETIAFVTAVAVEPFLLAGMVASATLGGWLGAGKVSRLARRPIQLGMGTALLVAAMFFMLRNLDWLPPGGTSMGLEGWRFAVAVGANFVLGALTTIGIGPFAPIMVVVSLLGLHPLGAFPIMMATCGIVQPVAGLQFFRSGRYALGPSLGLAIGGVFGSIVAVFIVKQVPLTALRWIVAAVVAYAGLSMLRSAAGERGRVPAAVAGA